jgi:hypothetical protein
MTLITPIYVDYIQHAMLFIMLIIMHIKYIDDKKVDTFVHCDIL